jgi:hypothetical protein
MIVAPGAGGTLTFSDSPWELAAWSGWGRCSTELRLVEVPRAYASPTPRELQGSTEPLVQLTTRIPRDLRQRLRLLCVEQGREMKDFIAEAIREYLRRRQAR